ncbi:hypothetical protein GCM10022403_030060 [Streptomyces coacervatus]|uniref:Lipoprotein n=1 Tax=Streptomyces coacervatus TaxID=647381 RepID=A0ABP7HM93_9ACTN|nr:hypothetical protein [Streptomyces coacervatus]MDF2271501.1 hypothetical protein [Streptomyces coacervatus]
MTRTPSRALVAAAMSAGALVSVSACVGAPLQGQAAKASRTAEHSAGHKAARSAKPSATTPAPPPPLTEAQAQAALLTQGDLGAPWAPTQGAATWRDGVLKAHADLPECRKLLDALYADDLFGAETGTRVVTGLDDAMDQTQLRYQVLSLKPADVDRTLTWMKTLPQTCGKFTAVTGRGTVQGVRVGEAELPVAGDARQGLRVTFTTTTAGVEQTVLTLDVAVVRVGDDTIALTQGGPGDVSANATKACVQAGVQRLTDVRKQARVRV